MPSSSDARHVPGRGPGIEARLRAELGEASLPDAVRQRQLTRLQTLAAELGPPTSTNGDGAHDAASNGAPSPVALSHTRPFSVDHDAILSGEDGQTPGDGGAITTVPDFGHTPDQGPGPAAERARRRWFAATTPRVAAASVVAFAVMVAGGGTAVAASTDALPGEALHYVKRAVEQVQVATAWSDSTEVEAYLGVAEARLEEATRLAAGDGDSAELPATLARHEAALDAAAERAGDDVALVTSVNAATERGAARLVELAERLPDTAAPQARDALERAGERLEQRLPNGRDNDGNAPDATDAPGGDRARPGSRGGDHDLAPPDRDSGQSPTEAPARDRAPRGSGNGEEPAQPDAGRGVDGGRAPADAGQPDGAGQQNGARQPDGAGQQNDAGPRADPGLQNDAGPRTDPGLQNDAGQVDGPDGADQADGPDGADQPDGASRPTGGHADEGQTEDTGQPDGAAQPRAGAAPDEPDEPGSETPDDGDAPDDTASGDAGPSAAGDAGSSNR